jgi:hypothetical protein
MRRTGVVKNGSGFFMQKNQSRAAIRLCRIRLFFCKSTSFIGLFK